MSSMSERLKGFPALSTEIRIVVCWMWVTTSCSLSAAFLSYPLGVVSNQPPLYSIQPPCWVNCMEGGLIGAQNHLE